jgi:polysaccharide biosynthesis PFTS motif protein
MTLTDPDAVIFEQVWTGNSDKIRQLVKKGYIVYYLDLDKAVLRKRDIQSYIDQKKLVDLSRMVFEYSIFLESRILAHKNIENVFWDLEQSSTTITILCRLFNSSHLVMTYKKDLLGKLIKIYDNQLRINEIAKREEKELIFYLSDGSYLYTGSYSVLLKNVRVRYEESLFSLYQKTKEWIHGVFSIFYPFYIVYKKVGWISLVPDAKEKYCLGINLKMPAIFSYNYHYINFLVDDIYRYPKEEVLFIDDSFDRTASSEYEAHGFTSFNFFNRRDSVSAEFFLGKFIRCFLPVWFICIIRSCFENPVFLRTTRSNLTDYIKWNLLVDKYQIKHHISILNADNVSKSIILSENHVKTWLIYPDNHSLTVHLKEKKEIPMDWDISYILSDNVVVDGNKMLRYFMSHPNKVSNYHVLGILPSQRVFEIRSGKIPSNLKGKIEKIRNSKKIVVVFDTTFDDRRQLKIADGIQFGKDILNLLDEIPEIGIIFKLKKFLSITPDLEPIYAELRNHPRCVLIEKTHKDCVFSTDIIAVADMVISAAYTSTTAEALGSKTKAIYYDIPGTEMGNEYYYNRYPNFVAHNYEELKKLITYWLYECDDDEFEIFLNRYVKGEIDPYLDGKAIDRLQNLLRSN